MRRELEDLRLAVECRALGKDLRRQSMLHSGMAAKNWQALADAMEIAAILLIRRALPGWRGWL